ncbi:unnamed protein product, partial [Ectocarpus sp. 13 AM-2016]
LFVSNVVTAVITARASSNIKISTTGSFTRRSSDSYSHTMRRRPSAVRTTSNSLYDTNPRWAILPVMVLAIGTREVTESAVSSAGSSFIIVSPLAPCPVSCPVSCPAPAGISG